MSAAARRRVAERGFTLLELLVAITLLGILMAALLGGLRLGARVWETGEERLDAVARVQVVQDFLRQRLTEALPFEVAVLAESGRSQFAFDGATDEMRFAGNLPEQLGAGVFLMQLTLAAGGADGRRRDLVLRWQPLELEDVPVEDPPEPEERILLAGVEGLELAYFGTLDPREAPDWWPQWSNEQGAFPGLIRIQVVFAEDDLRRWPELVVHPMVDRAALF
jgi:general secretion pathway protein J